MRKRMRSVLCMVVAIGSGMLWAADTPKPVKVFILAGDENCLEQGVISGRTAGSDAIFYPNEKPVKDELGRHVNCAVYKGVHAPGTDFDALTPEVTGPVAVGTQLTGVKRGKVTPLPDLALQDGYTTVLRGYLTVPRSGAYEVYPGAEDTGYNVTTVEGKDVWRREIGEAMGQALLELLRKNR